ncbi:HD domain-containing protein 2 [Chamberlinius hualienensis]
MADESVIRFFMKIGQLKQLRRTGWLRQKVKDPESVADHMYRMAIMSLFLKDEEPKLDISKCVKMAVVHDLAECIVGDITPFCGISKEEKLNREKAAMDELKDLAGPVVGEELMTLWEEYSQQETPVAKAVKDLDRFDMVLQAYEYEKQENRPKDLQEFFDDVTTKIQSKTVSDWMKELHKKREDGNQQ